MVPWDEHMRRFDWRQGEHVALIGPTGAGKTTIALQLLPLRRYSVVCATKPRDSTLAALQSRGWALRRTWPPDRTDERVLLWPKVRELGRAIETQREVFSRMMADAFVQGGWSLYFDELTYFTSTAAEAGLGLKRELMLLWLQGRSMALSLMISAQRPRNVSRETLSQASHYYLWGTGDADDLRALSSLGRADPALVRRRLQKLSGYEVLYVSARTGNMWTTTAPKLQKV